jgi:hypothetical protein
LSGAVAEPKMAAMPTPRTANMFDLILNRLTRSLPQATDPAAVRNWFDENSSWHSSSFELARGLEVVELRSALPPVFLDTMPAFRPPGA